MKLKLFAIMLRSGSVGILILMEKSPSAIRYAALLTCLRGSETRRESHKPINAPPIV